MQMFLQIGQVRHMMQQCQKNAVLRGALTWADMVEKYLGFEAGDVLEMHQYKGADYGLWFRLRDGRVIDWQGRESENDRALYDRPIN
jgi:hypothetical protein